VHESDIQITRGCFQINCRLSRKGIIEDNKKRFAIKLVLLYMTKMMDEKKITPQHYGLAMCD